MMGIRSLLLAAIVISNISWTTSRHHFRHHGNAHGSRHRRQDAGLYHPASYVIPGGVGTGPWGEWGKVSPCSRTCGGGVANQKRICLQVGPDDEPTCTGGDTKYFSCQTQDCPENAGDFRAEQCSEFDHQPYRGSGIRYTWVPYTKAPNPCELNCMPRGERFYYKQRAQVVDGTRCNDESFDVCVAGICQPAGCDMMLGSMAREDKCRNCRGNGTNCHTIEGLLDADDLTKGYNDMLLIPQGATNIFIEEVRASNNYLALRGKDNGEYYLNGKYEIVSPNSFIIAGTLWHYERSSQGLAAPDKLRCMGPTSEPLYLSLILQDYNVGIKYEYSVPSALALPRNEQYNWVHNSFSECSASCGGGFQVREVTCRSRGDLNIVDEKLCGDEFKPPTNQTCNIEDCPPRWVEGPWSPCSRPCGEGGTRSRQVFCEKTITNRETFRFSSMVADDECFPLLGPKPELYQTCNQNATCPTWFTGPWKPCDRLCGEGKETRLVVCHQRINGFVQLFEDRHCEVEKPITEKPCLLHPCDGVDWVISEWSGCDTCLSTVRTRVAHCATKDHKVIDSDLCSYHPSPVLVEQCDRTKLPSCQVQWYATQWSNCSVECGTGVKTRRVFCGLFDGASVIKVDDERCDAEYKYNDTTECVVPKEKCAAKWFAGPWSECSKKCGGGEQNRRVMCLFSTDDLKCDDETILHSTQSCNTGPCDKDDLLPLDSKSSPVLDDYDEEDCIGEDEEYPEVGAEAIISSLTRFPDFIIGDDTTPTTDITGETGSGFDGFESSSTFTTDGTETSETYSTDVESTTEPDSTTKKEITQFPDFEYENDTTSTTDASEETGSGLDWFESSSASTTDGTKTPETTDTYSTDVESSTELDVTSSTESSTTPDNEFSSTESGSTTSESVSSTTENIDYSTESSITESDMSSITDDGKSSTTETTVSGSTENSESTSSESTDSSTIESDISSTTENKLSSTTEYGPSITTEDISTTEGSTDSTTAESSTKLSTESSTTESDITGTSGSTETAETEESSTSPGSTDSTSTESSTMLSTESSTTESDMTGTSGSTETTETEESSTSPGSTDSTTTESSTKLSTESSTTESDITVTSGSTETTETEESSTSSVSTDSTTAESSTELSTESSTTESNITGTSGSTETTETEESTTSPGSTDSTTAESSTKLSTESSTTESDITGTSGSTETSETAESSTSPGSTDSITAESSTTESSTTESDITGTSGSTETTETEGSSTSPVSTDSTTAESSTMLSTESSTTESDITGTSGSTETTETEESSTSPGSTDSSTTESSTIYSTESSTSGSTETTETAESSTSPGTTDASTSSEEPLTNESSVTEKTPWDWASTVGVITNKPRCKPRKIAKCTRSKFGCCPDKKTPATGPFDEGCPNPETCKDSKSGCCPDGVSPAAGPFGRGCPITPCNETLYGCCSDNVTAAEDNNQDGCPPPPPACKTSKFGCCDDNDTEAKGPEKQGCPETEIPITTEKFTTAVDKGCATSEFGCCFDNETDASGPNGEGCPCSISEFGCCPDGITTASGNQLEGCLMVCNTSAYGCCPDGETPAHGPNFEGCCLQHEFGCCPDNYRLAKGPEDEGCECQNARFGCCADNVTIARGPNMEGCGCEHSQYGCCPDRHTEAKGLDYIGCECHTHQFGCCPDGVTIATGPELEGCRCERSKYGCCGDEMTAAKGPNMKGCDCSNSKYGCCPDGETEAEGEKFLNCANVPVNRQAACALNFTQGTCANYTALWFYDMEYGGCSQFWYGGCDGNANRFVSKAECEDVCVQPSPKDTCNLPKVKARCNGYNVRWYYNSEREQCSQFVYGGCLGNANNFDTKEICEERCEPEKTKDQCNLELERGPCAGNYVRWGFSAERRRCEQFVWGGCGGNNNRYDSEAACKLKCNPPGQPRQECSLPQDPGNCTEKHPVWSFSKTENRCVPFYYSGCGGNDNRFNSEQSCDERCPSAFVQEICTLPAMVGDCVDYTIKWFFDTTKKRCREFYYGGCGGNENNFLSESECENRCSEQSTTTTIKPELLQPQTEPAVNQQISEFCLLDIDKGPCTQSLQHWAYDESSGNCIQFEYGGCGGNRNNFPTFEYCQRYCGAPSPPQDVCQLPFVTGPCDQSIMQWFYDTASNTCSSFTYGGCEGNGNRFNSRADCEQKCHVQTLPPPTTTTPITTTIASREEAECTTPVSLTPCGENVTVYYYDSWSKDCLVGDFGACRYSNSYRTEEECERRCGAFKQLDVCGSRLDPGPCLNAIPKFYWDPLSGSCRGFAYGGCLGGPNRFSTEDECEEICGATGPDSRCLMPVSSGTPGCGTPSRRWYYSTVSGECVAFVYSGCGGNDNNFHTYEECASCKKHPSPVPEAETGNEVLPDCDSNNEECATLQCEYGIQRTRLSTGCERCICNDHPCANKQCSSEERCVATPYRDDNTFDILYSSDCRLVNKSGSCPSNTESTSSIERRCSHQCYDDADCPGVGKCCEQGCSKLCLEPAVVTSPAPTVTTHVPEPPREPSVNPATKPEVHASLGGTATLICLFHGNPPPKISWQRGQVMIESDVGRYRLLSDGSLEIVSLYRNDSGVYICIADNGLGIARQEVNLQVDEAETGNEVLPDCDSNNAECAELQCEYGVQRIRLSTGCERCICNDHPCANKLCLSGERCVATPYRDAITHDILYSSDCRLANKSGSCPSGEVSVSSIESSCTHQCYDDADCLGVGKCCEQGCSKLCLEPVVATSPAPVVTTHVPETGNEVLPDCDSYNAECAALQCEYGITRTRLSTGCERCICNDHPCANKQCSSDERCVATPYRDDNTFDILYSSECRLANKSGSCPSNAVSTSSIERRCRHQCYDDADCPGVGKCCDQGCSKLCLEPAVATSPTPTVTTYVPEPQREPSVDPDTEPEVRANLGGKATLRCLFHGNPPPKITWKRRHLMIESDVGRYRLLSDGSLEIVSLYRNDSGVYICIADNGLGIARQEVNLQVDDGVEGPAGIAGSLDAVVVGELGQPLSIRCMAYGYPQPSIYWYRGTNGPMVPYSSVQYEARDNVLQIKKLSVDILGKYSCQTYNGIGKPVDWSITVKAYRNNGFENSLFLVSRQNEEVTTPRQPQTQATTTIAPEIEIPLYTVPVTTRIVSERTRLPAGSELSLLCEVDGYPIPEVYWTKDSAPISSDDRITVTETRLTVSRANTSDTGLYGCHAFNAFNSHYSSVQISVEGLYIPPTCKDNPFFANCHLIVRSNFCSHKYYSSFCCKSCVEAGQLDVRSLQLQADNTLYRK